ncbi:hypothetical protein [Pararhizobium antarcticum]|uniref:Uncharacterized protein n=1 Tax=Pararhizobium antarcticum TaxID=1798805 RepID=A0A657LTT6_9HYPH|nr:hypothetical protein [Pararhizobium antarcticum]OJF97599.1 hypothetical protein AX760_16695 [Pararhizobium antarcticum]
MISSFQFTPSDRRPVVKVDTTEMVKAFEAKGGSVRRFEPGVTAHYDHIKGYLLDHGYALSIVRNMTIVKRVGAKGRGKVMNWAKVVALVDEIRASEGKEPFKARKAA